MALSTVSGILTRIGLGKLGRLGLEPAQRYERAVRGADPHRRQEARPDPAGAGHRVTGSRPRSRAAHRRRRHRSQQSAGSTCTSRSTTRPAWPTSRSSPTRRRSPRSGSCAAPSTHFASYGIAVERADHRQRLGLPLDRPRDRLPRARASVISAPAPTDPRPTARPSGSSAPCSAAGPTARSTATAQSATPPSPAGSSSTIAADHTAPSATGPHRPPQRTEQPPRVLQLALGI